MKIVLSGPPRSGKSCFREGLKQAIRRIPGAPYPYVITACPDGEGSWFQATVERDANLAAECKAAYKSAFTPAFVERVRVSVERCELPLTVIDIGGRISPENAAICAAATQAVILSGDLSKVSEWQEFWASLRIPVIGVIHSDYTATEDIVPTIRDGVFRGSVHHLERGEPVAGRPTIRWVAEWLVKACQGP